MTLHWDSVLALALGHELGWPQRSCYSSPEPAANTAGQGEAPSENHLPRGLGYVLTNRSMDVDGVCLDAGL